MKLHWTRIISLLIGITLGGIGADQYLHPNCLAPAVYEEEHKILTLVVEGTREARHQHARNASAAMLHDSTYFHRKAKKKLQRFEKRYSKCEVHSDEEPR